MAEELLPKRARFIYKIRDDFRRVFVNGVYGGISTRGELRMDFFLEHFPIPEDEVMEVTPEGGVKHIPKPQPEEVTAVREVIVGLLMNQDQALSIAEWILEKVKAFEKARAAEEKSEGDE